MTLQSPWTQRYFLFLLVLLVVYTENTTVQAAGTARNRRKNGNPQSRSVRVMNKSGARIDIFWIHPNTRELAPSHTEGDGVMYGGETGISSYIGHEFEVVELPSKKTKKCVQKECRKTTFAVNMKEDQCTFTIQMRMIHLTSDFFSLIQFAFSPFSSTLHY